MRKRITKTAREWLAAKELKYCTKCERVKDIEEFTKDKTRVDGLDLWCRDCKKVQNDLHNPLYDGSRPEDHEFPPGPTGYSNAHKRPLAIHGSASNYQCIGEGCGRQAQDWAYQGGCPNEQSGERLDGRTGKSRIVHWTRDHTYYAPMCKSCHIKMDMAEASLRQGS